MPLANAGALLYPFVGSIDSAGQFGIGHDFCRKITAGAGDA
jgi:hypothetical protein